MILRPVVVVVEEFDRWVTGRCLRRQWGWD